MKNVIKLLFFAQIAQLPPPFVIPRFGHRHYVLRNAVVLPHAILFGYLVGSRCTLPFPSELKLSGMVTNGPQLDSLAMVVLSWIEIKPTVSPLSIAFSFGSGHISTSGVLRRLWAWTGAAGGEADCGIAGRVTYTFCGVPLWRVFLSLSRKRRRRKGTDADIMPLLV